MEKVAKVGGGGGGGGGCSGMLAWFLSRSRRRLRVHLREGEHKRHERERERERGPRTLLPVLNVALEHFVVTTWLHPKNSHFGALIVFRALIVVDPADYFPEKCMTKFNESTI